jgi:hypothetical protein
MTTKFFRFLSRRGGNEKTGITEPSSSNGSSPYLNSVAKKKEINIINQSQLTINNNESEQNGRPGRHTKLTGCEDLKESIEHYNQRCAALRQMKEEEKLNSNAAISNNSKPQMSKTSFLSFKTFGKYKNSKTTTSTKVN